ncbi:hypothetical protein SISSUDRAFT_1039503 [Sistotremastrum suecicum HHB10207 ss-3]|uniref:Conserved oligomeric Golgi complex subunit 7 n=1 Tax=Sistotremastrum suecicum HHB10207 ss-3 TaxID=1314776 RepID=A0A166IZ80_9AGAM|nr:hypothetical protein SISSUDRAFT_1039503 [Sistotremastrum suecicum HHB10207 ss-3]
MVLTSTLLESLEDCTDVTTWVNELLENSSETDVRSNGDAAHVASLIELDRRVGQLATQLEVLAQDTSTELENTIDDISRTVPRLTYDFQFMRESTQSLQLSLSRAQLKQSTTHGTDLETGSVFQTLKKLDRVKRNMVASRDVLLQAEQWSTLEGEVTALIGENELPSYQKAAERLGDARKSMALFQDTPEYEPRWTLLVSLQNQLEASLSTALVVAITSNHFPNCKAFYDIFSRIQRETEFRNYYYGARRLKLIEAWSQVAALDCGESPSSDQSESVKFSDLLGRFFNDFTTLLADEKNNIPAVFPNPLPTISAFIQNIFDALSPPFSQRLSNLTAYYGPTALLEIIKVYRLTEQFASAASRLLEGMATPNAMPPFLSSHSLDGSEDASDARTKSHGRRHSKRMSMSRRAPSSTLLTLTPDTESWEQSLFESFLDLQCDYPKLEGKLLEVSLGQPLDVSGGTSGLAGNESARVFREYFSQIFTVSEEAMLRCMSFTYGFGLHGLVETLEQVLESFISSTQKQLLNSRLLPSHGGSKVNYTDEIYYTDEDWAAFQFFLHLLEASRTAFERLFALNNRLRDTFAPTARVLEEFGADAFLPILPGASRGQTKLLLQSTLNSMEQRDLLHTVATSPDSLNPSSFLPRANTSLNTFTKTCQKLLQQTILTPLITSLTSYPALATWSSAPPQSRDGAPSIPQFSISPTPNMQRVAEGLLNLPHLFEVHVDDAALAFSIETLPFISADFLKSIHDERQSLGELPRSAASRKGSTAQRTLPPEVVTGTWLSSLTLSLLSHLTREVLPAIQSLSSQGSAQLSSDLGYLSNIVKSLNVEWEELEEWRELTSMTEGETKEKLRSAEGSSSRILERFASLRGWREPT